MNKWTGIGATIGALAASVAVTALSAKQVDVAEHWMEIVGTVSAGVAALAAAFIAAVKAKRNP